MMEEDLDTLGFQHKVVLGKETAARDAGECDGGLTWLLKLVAHLGCISQARRLSPG